MRLIIIGREYNNIGIYIGRTSAGNIMRTGVGGFTRLNTKQSGIILLLLLYDCCGEDFFPVFF